MVANMAEQFVGLTMLVTLSSPLDAQLRGRVSSVVAGQSLTLSDGMFDDPLDAMLCLSSPLRTIDGSHVKLWCGQADCFYSLLPEQWQVYHRNHDPSHPYQGSG